ncbi:murein hydrolase activator EnvC family protein [Catenuloplanes nepalensis]|uniref:murein hydrolase activator EnvC family protein n=1 Tax=Catenuloplanes nepalensis TaxID=587533 RepID=UPI0027D8330C|nr:M23 family metallopeptidase [Catenuloplanes nepalensis]
MAAPTPSVGSGSPTTSPAPGPASPSTSTPASSEPARTSAPGSSAPAGSGYVWPISGPPPPIHRRFDPPPQPWLTGHRGVDLGAPPGAIVRSAGAGTVVFAGQVAGQGVVSVEHAGGIRTTYQPLHVGVTAGLLVTVDAPLGTLATGHVGCPAAACLHWGLRRGAEYLDPLLLLALGRARLLPRQPSP